MTTAGRRVAWLPIVDAGLALGDPGREHLRLSRDGIVHHRVDTTTGRLEVTHRWSWDDVDDLQVEAPSSRTRRPGRWAFATAAVLTAMGLGPDVATSDVRVRIVLSAGGEHLVLCHGHPGRGYPDDEQAHAHDVLRRLVHDEEARRQLDHPDGHLP